MGITVHFEGALRSEAALDEVRREAAAFASARGWPVEQVDRDDEVWRDGEPERGRVRGVTLEPHARCDPLRLWFDYDLVAADFCKTQFAGATVHLDVVRLFVLLRRCFARLSVSDGTGYFDGRADAQDVLRYFDEAPRL